MSPGIKKEPLLQITEEHLETGLRGIPVGYCVTSFVDPRKGLYYGEKPLHEIAFWKPEEVIYLLYHGRVGNKKEVEALSQELQARAFLSESVVEHIVKLPREGDPMKLLSMAVLVLGMLEATGNYREDALNCIAKMPKLTALVINHHAGWGGIHHIELEGYMEDFPSLLNISQKGEELAQELSQVFTLFNILHYDHGGGNLSVFVAKAVASGLEDIYGSIAAGINALAGKRHGGANVEALYFVEEFLQTLGPNATASEVEQLIRQKIEQKALIYGFGHAVLRVEDPRATIFYEVAQKYYPEHPLVKMAQLIRLSGTKVLKENPKIACPYPNVDAISGTLLVAAGFPYPHYFPLLFALSRTVGMAIQIVYERVEARGGKGTPIIRPSYPFKPLVR